MSDVKENRTILKCLVGSCAHGLDTPESDKDYRSVSERGRLIQSDDFTHDACLTISGDFANDQQRKHYAEEIVRRLNRKDV